MAEYIEREALLEDIQAAVENEGMGGMVAGALKRYVKRVPAADVAPVQKWISVKDRLPEPKENAICINRHGDMMIGTYTEWGWMFPCYFEGPTHWMPLPEPPKEE